MLRYLIPVAVLVLAVRYRQAVWRRIGDWWGYEPGAASADFGARWEPPPANGLPAA